MNKLNLLFLHGFPFNASSWDAQAIHFGKDHQVFAPDLRGHASGPQDNPPWFIHHFVEDMKALLDRKGVDKAVVCGLSMGGYVALHFVQKYPERVKALILCDTQAGADSNEAKDKRYAAEQKIYAAGLPAYAEEFSKNVLSKETLNENLELQKKVIGMITNNNISAVTMILATLASRRDSTPFLAGIEVPTLVIVGDEDTVTPPNLAKLLTDKISGAKLALIPGAGHLSNMEQPEEFNRVVGEFLAGLSN
ncbi:MAG: alpha/beta fold hydrolase [Bdellovibrionota bacterium]